MSTGATTYRYLGLGGTWPGFEARGLLTMSDGALALAPVPDLLPLDAPLTGAELEGPLGVTVDDDGHVYVSDPGAGRIVRVDGCDGTTGPLPCFGRDGGLRDPRGVAYGPPGTLFIAEAGRGRVLVFDLASGQVRGSIGGPASAGLARRSSPGAFVSPWDVAVDASRRLYVADAGEPDPAGGRRFGSLQRFTPSGSYDCRFAAALDPSLEGMTPTSVAVASMPDSKEERLLVARADAPGLVVLRLDGTLDSESTARWKDLPAAISGRAIETRDDRVFVAGPRGTVLVFDLSGRFLGASREVAGEISGLAMDCGGRLVVHAGGRLLRDAGRGISFSRCGSFLAGPFEGPVARTPWSRLLVDLVDEAGGHLRLFTLSSDCFDGASGRRPALRTRAANAAVPSGGLPLCDGTWVETPACAEPVRDSALRTPGDVERGRWAAGAWDATALHVASEPSRYLWIAGVLRGDGTVSPRVRDIRLEHDPNGWLQRLPSVYRRNPVSRGFLRPFLGLHETVYDSAADLIDDLPLLFDPWAARDDADAPWLDWLADWMDFPLRGTWSPEERRATVAAAFGLQAERGTAAALRDRIRRYTGADVRIVDGASRASLWVLGDTPLGRDSRLAGAEAQGAVLGTTATLGSSHLIRSEDAGTPVLDAATHCFAVLVRSSDLTGPDALDRIRAVVEREKPAHTTYRLCVIRPAMRAGYQATLGVDAIVGGPPRSTSWKGAPLGRETVLSGRRPHRRVGPNATTPITVG